MTIVRSPDDSRYGVLGLRRRIFLVLLASAALLAGCTGKEDEARRLALRWFTGEIERIGYVDNGSGLYATPATPATGLLLGDALEAQIREVRVTGAREATLDPADRQRGITWHGQVFVVYDYREQYYQNRQPRGWSEWARETTVLNLEQRGGQWYVTRLK